MQAGRPPSWRASPGQQVRETDPGPSAYCACARLKKPSRRAPYGWREQLNRLPAPLTGLSIEYDQGGPSRPRLQLLHAPQVLVQLVHAFQRLPVPGTVTGSTCANVCHARRRKRCGLILKRRNQRLTLREKQGE